MEQPQLSAAELSKLPYFSRDEIAQHNVATDCWVSFFGLVHDLTPLIKEHKGTFHLPSRRPPRQHADIP
jgi:cytochrome b involved in lipid metabolism